MKSGIENGGDMKNTFVCLMFSVLIIGCATKPLQLQSDGEFLVLEYTAAIFDEGSEKSGVESTNFTYRFEIDQENPLVYEITPNASPIAYEIRIQPDSIMEYSIMGNTEKSIYRFYEDHQITRAEDTSIHNIPVKKFTVLLQSQPKYIQEIYLQPVDSLRIAFPIKKFGVSVSPKSTDPVGHIAFLPELYKEGVPVRVLVPLPLDGILAQIGAGIPNDFRRKVQVKADLEAHYLQLDLVNMSVESERTIPDIGTKQ
jgi:hypothetical protein